MDAVFRTSGAGDRTSRKRRDVMFRALACVTPGDEFVRGAVRRLWVREGFAINGFQANYDVYPDGQQFIFVRDLTRNVRQIHVVLDWFDQLTEGQGN